MIECRFETTVSCVLTVLVRGLSLCLLVLPASKNVNERLISFLLLQRCCCPLKTLHCCVKVLRRLAVHTRNRFCKPWLVAKQAFQSSIRRRPITHVACWTIIRICSHVCGQQLSPVKVHMAPLWSSVFWHYNTQPALRHRFRYLSGSKQKLFKKLRTIHFSSVMWIFLFLVSCVGPKAP